MVKLITVASNGKVFRFGPGSSFEMLDGRTLTIRAADNGKNPPHPIVGIFHGDWAMEVER